ncbi:MAG: hypothetical protein WBI44_01370 [Syntrophaceticus sp.]
MAAPIGKKHHINQPSNKCKNKIETPQVKEPTKVEDDEQKVHLEFPYDDLELLYEYTLKEMGIKNPFK